MMNEVLRGDIRRAVSDALDIGTVAMLPTNQKIVEGIDAAIATLMEAGVIVVPRFTPAQVRQLRQIEREAWPLRQSSNLSPTVYPSELRVQAELRPCAGLPDPEAPAKS